MIECASAKERRTFVIYPDDTLFVIMTKAEQAAHWPLIRECTFEPRVTHWFHAADSRVHQGTGERLWLLEDTIRLVDLAEAATQGRWLFFCLAGWSRSVAAASALAEHYKRPLMLHSIHHTEFANTRIYRSIITYLKEQRG